MHKLIVVIVLVFTVVSMAQNRQEKSVKELFEGPSPAKPGVGSAAAAPAVETAGPIAEVNDQEVSRNEFFKILYGSAGTRVLRQIIGLKLAEQMAGAEGVEPSKSDIDMEFRTVVEQLGPEKDALGKALTFDDRERLLRGILARRGIGYDEFQIGIRQQAYLRAVAKKKVKVTEELVRTEFEQNYGKKRRCRAIMLPDVKVAQEIYNRLQKGEKFETLAGNHSIDLDSALLGGYIGELGPHDAKFPAIVSQTVFSLPVDKFSSPIKVNDQVWILKVDQEVAPTTMPMENVRDSLARKVQKRLEDQMIEKIQTELFMTAKIKVNDKLLAKPFDAWFKELQNESR